MLYWGLWTSPFMRWRLSERLLWIQIESASTQPLTTQSKRKQSEKPFFFYMFNLHKGYIRICTIRIQIKSEHREDEGPSWVDRHNSKVIDFLVSQFGYPCIIFSKFRRALQQLENSSGSWSEVDVEEFCFLKETSNNEFDGSFIIINLDQRLHGLWLSLLNVMLVFVSKITNIQFWFRVLIEPHSLTWNYWWVSNLCAAHCVQILIIFHDSAYVH